MAILQPLIDLAHICYAHGIRHVVLSPGSRSAALTLAFSRHEGFKMYPVMDERSAGFIALGIAQQLGTPVVLLCTSGSAAYNLAPAISEAYFQQIPLLVLTADRPKEWTHQHDGQTIYQSEIYGKHVKKFFEFSADYSNSDVAWSVNRITNDAVNMASSVPFGPVHINIPIREPFYPAQDERMVRSEKIRIIKRTQVEVSLSIEVWHELLNEWDDASKILIVGGQHPKSDRLNKALLQISEELDVPVVGDSISNLRGSDQFIYHHDLILLSGDSAELVPDLLITYGLSLISKELKTFLRKNPAVVHWHIGQDVNWTDPLQTVTKQLAVSSEYFFENLFEKIDYQLFVQNSDSENDSAYLAAWLAKSAIARVILENNLSVLTELTDLTSIDFIIKSLNDTYQLQIGNSMPIRYVNLLGKSCDVNAVFCNRGTSGIDGSVSTALGAAMVNDMPTVLIVGDVSFLYDRNGLLVHFLPPNIKIIVLNNAGGNIFRMIDGPAKLPELGNFFETNHTYTAKRTAEDSGLLYTPISNLKLLQKELPFFLEYPNAGIMEIFTDPGHNASLWRELKSRMRDLY